jgi:cytochrome b-561
MSQWLEERLELNRLRRKYFRKAFPVHHTYFLGEITLAAFVTLVLTGIFLTMNYESSSTLVTVAKEDVPAAYASILYIDSLPFGAVIRSIHHWSADVMLAAAFLHLLRILLTGSYKKPREVNWLVGLALLGLSLGAIFTGYALLDDAFAVTATRIGYGIAVSIPWAGSWIAQVFFGGVYPTSHSLPRLYPIHILWLPLVLMGLIGAHLLIMVKQKHTQTGASRWIAPGRILGVPLVPQQLLVSAALYFLYLGGVSMVAGALIAHPVSAFGPPGVTTPSVKPEWYFLWIYGLLQLIPSTWIVPLPGGGTLGPEFLGGVFVPILLGVAAVLLPFVDTRRSALRYMELPSEHPWRTGGTLGLLAFFFVGTLAGYHGDVPVPLPILWILLIAAPILTCVAAAVMLQRRHAITGLRGTGDQLQPRDDTASSAKGGTPGAE